MSAPEPTSKASQIRVYLQKHYPCQEIPRGDMAEIARRFGVSGVLVRAQAARLSIALMDNHATTCPGCGGPKSDRRAHECRKCRSAHSQRRTLLDLVCDYCGKEFQRTLERHVYYTSLVERTGVSHNGIYCSVSCAGKVNGKRYGWGAKAQRAERLG